MLEKTRKGARKDKSGYLEWMGRIIGMTNIEIYCKKVLEV